jgi:hypothetical protein
MSDAKAVGGHAMSYNEFRNICIRRNCCALKDDDKCPDYPCLMYDELRGDCRTIEEVYELMVEEYEEDSK